MNHIAEVTAGLAYIPAGVLFGYLLLQPLAADLTIACRYLQTQYWPYVIAIVAMLVSVALSNGLKLNYRKTQFIHFFLNLAACLFWLASGLIFLLLDDIVPAVYLGATGLGLTLVPGLSYLHIRSKGRHRALHMSLCTFWLLAGVATTATIVAQDKAGGPTADGGRVQAVLHQYVAIALLASGSLELVLIGLVELLHREAIVDYRKPLDYDTAMAHDSGRLFDGRRRSFGAFAQFGRGKWGAPPQALEPARGAWGGCRFRKLWTAYAIATKLVGLLAFYWVLQLLGMVATVELFQEPDAWYCQFWLLAAGALLTSVLTLLLSPKLLFLLASVLYLVGLVLAVAFYAADLKPLEFAVAKLLFFASLGAALPLPAINILELAPLNYNEAALALGTAFELLAIALLQYFGTRDGRLFGVKAMPDAALGLPDVDKGVIEAHYITAIVLGVVCAVLVLWHMPNTKHKSLPEIEDALARMRSYFAFCRSVLPAPAAELNGARPGDSITSVAELVEDSQLSARNAARFAALYSESPEPRDGSYDSRSPFNDFGHELAAANGHHHHHLDGRLEAMRMAETMAAAGRPRRSLSPRQKQLQRLHETNYLNARLMHQQRGLESPTGSDQFARARGPLPLHPFQPTEIFQPSPLLPLVARTGSRAGQRTEPPIGSLTVKSEPGGAVLGSGLHPRRVGAPAPPPMPPADYLTKSLPRVKAVRQSRIPPVVSKEEEPEEEIVPGVEYSHNLVPSQFLRQSLQNSQLFR